MKKHITVSLTIEAKDLLESFKNFSQIQLWEAEIYTTYKNLGFKPIEDYRDLSDILGKDFADAFYTKKTHLYSIYQIEMSNQVIRDLISRKIEIEAEIALTKNTKEYWEEVRDKGVCIYELHKECNVLADFFPGV